MNSLPDIVTVEEFEQRGGDLLLEDGEKLDKEANEHKFQLKRLQYELQERKKLVGVAEGLQKKVSTVKSFFKA